MQRRVLLGAGAAIIVVAGFLTFRTTTRHEAGRALDQGIDQLIARLPPGYAVRHGVTELNPLTSALTVHDLVVQKDGRTLATADTVTLAGADADALQDVFDPAHYPDGHPKWTDRRLLIADASVEGVQILPHDPSPQTGGVVIKRIALHRLSGHPFTMPPTEENSRKPAFLADVALTLSVDTMRGRDAVAGGDTAPGVAGGGRAKLATLTLTDYDGGRFTGMAIDGFVVDGTSGASRRFHGAINAAEVKGADLRAMLTGIRRTGHAERGQLSGGQSDAAGLSGLLVDIEKGPHVEVAELRATREHADDGVAGGRAWAHGVVFALGQTAVPASASASLAAFGMKSLALDVDAHAQTVGMRSTLHEDIVLKDLATLHVDGMISGYDTAFATPGKPFAALEAATLEKAAIVLEDHSLTNRLLAVAAVQMHATPEIVRAQLAVPLVAMGLMMPQQPDIADQLTAFLNHPGTLTATMDPPQKPTLGDVAKAPLPSRAAMLGLHIIAK